MQREQLTKYLKLSLPIAKNGIFWNGEPGEFSNIGFNLNYSQRFGNTPYAMNTKIYGIYNGKPRPHNGHDIAGDINTPIVLPCRAWISCVAYDPANAKGADPLGYGNYIFYETEPQTINGETFKFEFATAHHSKPLVKAYQWLEKGTEIALMGSTGMSTGPHTHWGMRPLIRTKDGGWEYMFKDEEGMAYRGYIDAEPFLETPIIYDKQILINARKNMMKLIQKNGASDIFAVDNASGKANLILNFDSFQRGLELGLWEDKITKVDTIPERGAIIILVKDN